MSKVGEYVGAARKANSLRPRWDSGHPYAGIAPVEMLPSAEVTDMGGLRIYNAARAGEAVLDIREATALARWILDVYDSPYRTSAK